MSGQESPENDDLLRLTLLGALAVVAAASVLAQHADWFRQLAIIVAWIHVKPFAEFARLAPPELNFSAVREWLLAPSVFIDDNLPFLLTDASSHALWISISVSSRAALLVYGPALFWLAIDARTVRSDIANRKSHDLGSLLHKQAKHWPTSRILRHTAKLSNRCGNTSEEQIPILCHRWAGNPAKGQNGELLPQTLRAREPSGMDPAVRPETWLRMHGLARKIDPSEQALQQVYDSQRWGRLSDKEWSGLTNDVVCEVMECQFGAAWRGFEQLSSLHRSLAALFALFHDFRSEEGHALLSRLAVLADRNVMKPLTMNEAIAADCGLESEISTILESNAGKRLLAVANRHAWLRTAFIGMLYAARKDRGVVACASFIWLKREDRALWYALNSLGNAAAVVEAAGVFAHYRAERQIRRPLHRPAVFQASRAFIDTYLDMSPQRLTHRSVVAEFRKPVGIRLEEMARSTGRAVKAEDCIGFDLER